MFIGFTVGALYYQNPPDAKLNFLAHDAQPPALAHESRQHPRPAASDLGVTVAREGLGGLGLDLEPQKKGGSLRQCHFRSWKGSV